MAFPDDCFGLLFQGTISDAYFRWQFRMTVSDYCSRWLFRVRASDYFSGWLFGLLLFGLLSISGNSFEWLFRMIDLHEFTKWKWSLDHLLTTTLHLNGSFVISRPFHNSTTESYFSDQFIFPRLIPISTNHWSDDWFAFERWLPTAELRPNSPW